MPAVQNLLDVVALHALDTVVKVVHWRQLYLFRRTVGYFPCVALPRRYHERMFWRKVFDHNPLFRTFSDKLAAKAWIAERLPQARIPRTLWIARRADEIADQPLDRSVVVKASHGCNFNFFPSGSADDRRRLASASRRWLRLEYGHEFLEWSYFGLRRLVFGEQRIPVAHPRGLLDISVRCADGRAVMTSLKLDNKTVRSTYGYFDPQGRRVVIDPDDEGLEPDFEPPACVAEAVRMAEQLSVGVDYARFDFLSDWHEIWAGEVTVYPAAGLAESTPEARIHHEIPIERAWDLRKSWFLTSPQQGWRSLYARVLRRTLEREAAGDPSQPTPGAAQAAL